MNNNSNNLEIVDDFPELGERVLDEEITLLIPPLRDKLLNLLEGSDEGSDLRKSQHR